MNGSSTIPPVPPPAPRPFEPIVFWIAVVVGGLAALFGAAGIYDAAQSSGSGEWSGLGVLATMAVDIPTGLVVLGLAFTQRRRQRRLGLVVGGIILIALPFLAANALHQHRAQQRREAEERVLRRTREVLDEQPK